MEKYPNNFFHIRRENSEAGKPLAFGDLTLDKLSKDAADKRKSRFRKLNVKVTNTENGKSKVLTQQEYEILHLLMASATTDTPISMQDINEWMYRDIPEDKDMPISNVTSVNLSKLRKVLATIRSRTKIQRMKRGKSAVGSKDVILKIKE